jgi:hypothetical protein
VSGAAARKSMEYRRNRAIVEARRDPCARCCGEIDYYGPRYFVVNGVRRENLLAFDCGHRLALALGGTEELHNLQAEHVKCSRHAGGRLGLSIRYGTRPTASMWTRW